jgi:hypothetical protein
VPISPNAFRHSSVNHTHAFTPRRMAYKISSTDPICRATGPGPCLIQARGIEYGCHNGQLAASLKTIHPEAGYGLTYFSLSYSIGERNTFHMFTFSLSLSSLYPFETPNTMQDVTLNCYPQLTKTISVPTEKVVFLQKDERERECELKLWIQIYLVSCTFSFSLSHDLRWVSSGNNTPSLRSWMKSV